MGFSGWIDGIAKGAGIFAIDKNLGLEKGILGILGNFYHMEKGEGGFGDVFTFLRSQTVNLGE